MFGAAEAFESVVAFGSAAAAVDGGAGSSVATPVDGGRGAAVEVDVGAAGVFESSITSSGGRVAGAIAFGCVAGAYFKAKSESTTTSPASAPPKKYARPPLGAGAIGSAGSGPKPKVYVPPPPPPRAQPKKVDCDPPYTEDALGHKHYKLQCL